MKTVLPLGKDPPAITSLSFNHNGKILAAAATDGMIHMFGILTIILRSIINCKTVIFWHLCIFIFIFLWNSKYEFIQGTFVVCMVLG